MQTMVSNPAPALILWVVSSLPAPPAPPKRPADPGTSALAAFSPIRISNKAPPGHYKKVAANEHSPEVMGWTNNKGEKKHTLSLAVVVLGNLFHTMDRYHPTRAAGAQMEKQHFPNCLISPPASAPYPVEPVHKSHSSR